MAFRARDEDEAEIQREELCERFGRWRARRTDHREADAFDVELLLSWKWAYADGDYGWWTREHVDEVLLDHLPRKLSAPPQAAATIPASLAALVTFLDDEGLLSEGSDPAADVARRALAQRRAFLDAMDDPANFGMAKRLFSAAGFAGDDVPGDDELAAAMDAFNALPFEERGRILGLVDDEAPDEEILPLPLRSWPSDDELAERAASVPLVAQVDRLHAAVPAAGLKLTKAGNLTVADGLRLANAAGVDVGVTSARSSTELRELFGLGQVAIEGGALEFEGNRMVARPTWPEEAPVERWRRVVQAVINVGAARVQFGASQPSPLQFVDEADDLALQAVAMLWLAGEPLPRTAFADVLGEYVGSVASPFPGMDMDRVIREGCRRRVDDVLASLAAAGVVELDGDQVVLPDHGAGIMAPILAGAGFDVLAPATVAGLSAAEVLDRAASRDEDPALLAPWWAADDRPARAAELVAELVRRPEPARVLTGLALLESFGADAHDALLAARDTVIGPHALLALANAGVVDPDEISPETVLRAGIDVFVALADAGSPADMIEQMLGAVPPAEHTGLVDHLAASDHPRTGEMLELIGRHHPDRTVAKYARKAAHRWRSRSATR